MQDKTNIVLIGFMGTGKSATGRLVARRLEREFVDMDAQVEARTGRKISEIFRIEGEEAFRRYERELVQELSARRNLVIAAGGGVVLNPENTRDFSHSGLVICLKAATSAILQRVKCEDHRPLLENGDKAKRIMDLLDVRRGLYDAIPCQVDTTYMSPESTADRVIELYNEFVESPQ